jgi:signal transduction histidine kinase/ActR/RegA family two-component response regulator
MRISRYNLEFKHLSIRYKLTLITMLTSTIAVVLVCAAFMAFELVEFRKGMVRDLSILAEIVGTNSAAALMFDDEKAAEEILLALRAKTHVVSACIYRSGGRLFATYVRGGGVESFPHRPPAAGYRFTGEHLELSRPIVLDREAIGVLFIRYDSVEIQGRLKRVVLIALFVFWISIMAALALSTRLQRLISRPILHLAEIARRVSKDKDYSVRAVKENEDESGLLIDGFNDMLTQIQKRDQALQRDQEELELRIHERTEALQQEITERKRAEEEKERIQAQLLQAQKMEAIGVLAGGVAHDFNNLLTAIQGWTELVMQGVDGSAPAYQDLKEIRSATKRAADLTQQLLLFSRKKPMRMISTNLNQLVKSLYKICQRLIGENIEILTRFEDDLWTVKADRGTIEQLIMNLVVNAKDAMPGGGIISIQTENIIVDDFYSKGDPEARPGPFVRLTVSDDGLGMSRDTLKHIFEPFFTTKGVGKGTGLGLSVIYGIVKQHEGWINVYSELGHGSSFRVYLPAVPSSRHVEEDEKTSLQTFQGRGQRILVVEDELNVAEFNQKALNQYGYKVFLAKTLEEARHIFSDEQSRLDLVFSDVVLPDGSGIGLIDEFREQKPQLHVIMSSGYTDHKLQWPLIQDRGYRFLQKPYSLAELLKAFQEEMEIGQHD